MANLISVNSVIAMLREDEEEEEFSREYRPKSVCN